MTLLRYAHKPLNSYCDEIIHIYQLCYPEISSGQCDALLRLIQSEHCFGGAVICEKSGNAEQLAGFILLQDMQMQSADIIELAVAPDMRRAGVATSLLTYAFERSKQRNIEQILLEVRDSNSPALALYDANGFVQIGIRRGYYTSAVSPAQSEFQNQPSSEDAVVMQKKLNL